MWDDLAKQFKKDEIEQLPCPIIIVVSSCRVSKYRDVQLETTPITFYYINPQTKEAVNAYTITGEDTEQADTIRPATTGSDKLQASATKLQQKEVESTSVKTMKNRTQQPTGLMINESTSKDKGVDTESSTSTALTTKDSTNEDKSIPVESAAPASSRSNGMPVLDMSL
ncbi:hypothetical protein Tco_0236049 [Tanacetum coccineum]